MRGWTYVLTFQRLLGQRQLAEVFDIPLRGLENQHKYFRTRQATHKGVDPLLQVGELIVELFPPEGIGLEPLLVVLSAALRLRSTLRRRRLALDESHDDGRLVLSGKIDEIQQKLAGSAGQDAQIVQAHTKIVAA